MTEEELVNEFVAKLRHMKAMRDQWRHRCNDIGLRLLEHSINSVYDDLKRLGAEDRAREVLRA